MSFYDTIGLSSKELTKAQVAAMKQDDKILLLFDRYKTKETGQERILTPRRIWFLYKKEFGHIMLTSVRRSINTLYNQSKLIRKSDKVQINCPVDNFRTKEFAYKIIKD